MTLVCDTNVFYDAAAGKISIDEMKKKHGSIAVTPVSIMEIASKIEASNLEQRSAAARKALESDLILSDPELHLAGIWGVKTSLQEVPWKDVLLAISQAKTVEALEKGVEDAQAGVKRSVRLPLLQQARAFHYEGFVTDVVAALDSFIPGYAKKRSKGKMKQANAAAKKAFQLRVAEPRALFEVLLATRSRALLAADGQNSVPTAELESVVEKLVVYVTVYAKYFEKVGTVFAPQENDWGDLELFIYVNDGRRVATAENRWIEIASELGVGNLVVDTKA